MSNALRLSAVELRLLLRRKVTAFSVVVLPLGLVALTVYGPPPASPAEWGALASRHVLLLMVLSVYLVSLTVFTSRRQSLVLKRLRTTELGDRGILAGVLGPVVLVGLAQTVVVLVSCLVAGSPAPADPALLVLGVLLGLAAATAAGIATACLTRSVEAAQLTSLPVIMAAMAGLFLSASADPVTAGVGVALPLSGPADLVTRGWSGTGATVGDLPVPVLDVAGAALWVVVSLVAFSRWFRWEPRA